MEYDFDSLTEFLNYIDNASISDSFRGKKLASEDNDYGFTNTSSLQEAKDYCRYGYHEDFDKLVELKFSLEKYIKMQNTRGQQYNYYVGYAPDVKAYLEGNPLSMFDRQNPKNPLTQINIGMGYNRLKRQVERFKKATSNLTVPSEYGFQVNVQYILYQREQKQIENGGQDR